MKRKRNGYRLRILAAAVLGGCLLLTGCSSEIEGMQTRPRIMGATYMTRNNPFFDVLHESIESVVEGNGDILISRDPNQNQEKQNEQILEMIDEHIEILFLNPVDWEDVKPALEACYKAGVTVINIDTAVKDQEYVQTLIETDNYQAGVLCAEDMLERTSRGRIVVLDNPIQQSITQRTQGFLDTIDGIAGYEVVYQEAAGGEFEIGAEKMNAFLETGVGFDVILGGNDPTALGALSALQQYGYKKKVLIYGIDGSPDFKSMLASGDATGTAAQSPATIGRTAANTAYRLLDGEEIESYISIEPYMITEENLGEVDMANWQ